jgi:hypothetical protein
VSATDLQRRHAVISTNEPAGVACTGMSRCAAVQFVSRLLHLSAVPKPPPSANSCGGDKAPFHRGLLSVQLPPPPPSRAPHRPLIITAKDCCETSSGAAQTLPKMSKVHLCDARAEQAGFCEEAGCGWAPVRFPFPLADARPTPLVALPETALS